MENLISATRVGGHIIMIEAFQRNLDLLNAARAEFALHPIPRAHHNLYFTEDFLGQFSALERRFVENAPEHFLSTHYYVSRVLHAGLFKDKKFVRNSHFVRFFSESLGPAGEFSPVRGFIFRRTR